MVNTDMREYSFFTFGSFDAYGQQQISEEAQGTVKIAVYTSSQTAADNIKYRDCNYIGLTHDKNINNSYVIQYGDTRLKVLYVNSMGRFTQVFLKEI